MYLMNLGKPTKVAKLNEQMAIELGASLMGEVIIFSVAGGCLILEYNRQVAKETKKEEIRQAQLEKFTKDIEDLQSTTSRQEEEIRLLQNAIEDLAKHSRHKIPAIEQMKDSVIRKVNSSENELDISAKITSEAGNSRENREKPSLIQRAIEYFENDVLE